jgi:hypothetical protein
LSTMRLFRSIFPVCEPWVRNGLHRGNQLLIFSSCPDVFFGRFS